MLHASRWLYRRASLAALAAANKILLQVLQVRRSSREAQLPAPAPDAPLSTASNTGSTASPGVLAAPAADAEPEPASAGASNGGNNAAGGSGVLQRVAELYSAASIGPGGSSREAELREQVIKLRVRTHGGHACWAAAHAYRPKRSGTKSPPAARC